MKLMAALMLLTLVGCHATETQWYGYQTADLITRAEELKISLSPSAYAPIDAALKQYDAAVIAGDTSEMRKVLNALAEAEK